MTNVWLKCFMMKADEVRRISSQGYLSKPIENASAVWWNKKLSYGRGTALRTMWSKSIKSKQCIAIDNNWASPLRCVYGKLACHMGSHMNDYLPLGRVRIPHLLPAEASTRFSEPGGMKGRVDLCYVKADGWNLVNCCTTVRKK